MAQSTIFPIYLRAEYDRSGRGFEGLTASARQSVSDAQRVFESGFQQIQGVISKSLSIPRNASGSLDLNVDEYRRAAAEAEIFAKANRELATAMQVAGREAGELSRDERLVAAAARAVCCRSRAERCGASRAGYRG